MQELEKFTCIIYGCPRLSFVNEVRAKILKKMVGEDDMLSKKSKVDLARLPPCQDSLIPHMHRVNYRVACYRRANQPIFEKPKPYDPDQGWERNENGLLEPIWSKGPILPNSLIDILEKTDFNIRDEDADDEDESIDYEDLFTNEDNEDN